MAGDWIKMRVDLQSHPKIVRILSALRSDKFRVIGGLHAVWSVFDTHSVDGALAGYTPEAMDHVIGWPGFCGAMIDVGWMHWDGAQTLVMPEFFAHNGQSAKRRADDQKRKRDARKSDTSPQSVRNLSASGADICPDESGLEKRREEKREKIEEQQPTVAVRDADHPPADLPDRTPHADIVAMYHEELPMCPRVRVWDAGRKALLRSRWREDRERQDVDWWREFFRYVARCDFLVGKVQARDREPFVADLEWILSPKNFRKILEGRYEGRAA